MATHAERSRERREYVTSEFEFLYGWDNIDSIARRLGYKNTRSLSRVLTAWGRRDLARRLELPTLYPRDVNIIPPDPRPDRPRKGVLPAPD